MDVEGVVVSLFRKLILTVLNVHRVSQNYSNQILVNRKNPKMKVFQRTVLIIFILYNLYECLLKMSIQIISMSTTVKRPEIICY